MDIWTGLDESGGPITIELRFITSRPAGADCMWTFRDLEDGDYVAFLATPEGSGGSRTFTVKNGSAAAVVIRSPAVTLTGRVIRDGVGVKGALVRATGLPFVRPAVVTSSDADGRYAVTLDAPGRYQVEAPRVGVAKGELRSGANTMDIVGDDATATVQSGASRSYRSGPLPPPIAHYGAPPSAGR